MLLALFGVLAVLNLIASGAENETLEWATKPFLTPILALWLWRAEPATQAKAKGIVAGLLFSAAGDIALLNDGQWWFITGMAMFLFAHACYIATFIRHGALRRIKKTIIIGYLLVLASALVWLWPALSEVGLAVPMAGYAVALTTMAALATTFGWRTGLGGLLFLVSDLLIAIGVADAVTIPGPPLWVMLTYIPAQLLIATGWRISARS